MTSLHTSPCVVAASMRLSTTITNPADKLLCNVLARRALLRTHEAAEAVRTSHAHQLHVVLFDLIRGSGVDVPREPDEQLSNLVRESAARTLAAERELQMLLQELAAVGVRPLILKGAGLAYSIYRSPGLRVWRDFDLLFRTDDAMNAIAVLRARGYVGPEVDLKRLANYECTYRRIDTAGSSYKVDFHWKINNAQWLARAFDFRELWDEGITLPRLSPLARTLGFVHAFLLACVHRVGHRHAPFYLDGGARYAGDHLRWIFDIHLLVEVLSREQWSRIIQCAVANRLAFACWDSLCAAQEAFASVVPDDVMSSLGAAARTQGRMGISTRLSWMLANVRALPTFSDRTALLKEMMFPSAAYVREKYKPRGSRAALPVWYAYRIVRGVGRVLRARNDTR